MKKLVLLCFLPIVIMSKAKAQEWQLSPEVGLTLNFGTLTKSNQIGAEQFSGAHFGANISKKLAQNISVSSGLFHNSHHTTLKYVLPNDIIAYNFIRLNYLRVPIHLNYQYKVLKGNLNLNAGPYFGLGVGGFYDSLTRNGTNDDFVARDSKSIDWGYKNQQTNSIEYGLNLGIKYAWKNGMFLKAQYAIGLNSFPIYNLSSFRHQFITLGFGYDLSFNPKTNCKPK